MTAKEITPVAEAAANRQGCYVVDITVSRDNDITVVLDKETGTVGMEDCIAVNDAVLAAFDRDVEDYALTVTSPATKRASAWPGARRKPWTDRRKRCLSSTKRPSPTRF